MLQNLRFSSQFPVMAKVLAVKEACTMWKIYYQHDYLYIHYLLSLSLILRLQSQGIRLSISQVSVSHIPRYRHPCQESGNETRYLFLTLWISEV